MDETKLEFGYLRYREPSKENDFMLMIKCTESIFKKSDSKIIIKADDIYSNFEDYLDFSHAMYCRNEVHIKVTKKDIMNDMKIYEDVKDMIINEVKRKNKMNEIMSEYMNHPTEWMEQDIIWDKH